MSKKCLGIDFGTSSIKIFKHGEGIVLHEKNIIAIYQKKYTFAAGDEAFDMYEKAPANIKVSYPVKNGVIADIKNMQSLMDYFFEKIQGDNKHLKGADYYVAVPTDITEVEKRAYFDLIASTNVKAKKIQVVDKPIADAVGLGLDISNANGRLIMDIGANTTEISVLSLGGIVLSKLIPIGGNKFDESIISKIKKEHNFVIGEKTAELIKKNIGSAFVNEDEIAVCGRNLVTGLPSEIVINGEEVYEALNEHFQTIIDSVKMILERTPPEISSDIYKSGVYITGGSSQIRDLSKFIMDEIGLKVNLASDPECTVIQGLGTIMENPQMVQLDRNAKMQQ